NPKFACGPDCVGTRAGNAAQHPAVTDARERHLDKLSTALESSCLATRQRTEIGRDRRIRSSSWIAPKAGAWWASMGGAFGAIPDDTTSDTVRSYRAPC